MDKTMKFLRDVFLANHDGVKPAQIIATQGAECGYNHLRIFTQTPEQAEAKLATLHRVFNEEVPQPHPGDALLGNNGPGHEKLHGWFGLSYASYLTLPRTVLQSLPDDLQGRLAEVLTEVSEFCDARHLEYPPEGCRIEVRLRKEDGRYVRDELSNYERGRRRLWGNDAVASGGDK